MVNIIWNYGYLQFASVTKMFNYQNHGSISKERPFWYLYFFWGIFIRNIFTEDLCVPRAVYI